MRRPLMTCLPVMTLMFALAPAALSAQTPPAQTPPAAAQPPAQLAAAHCSQGSPFTTDAGLLLIQIKPDQTAAFEELVAKLKAGVAKTTDEGIKKQMAGFKVYKSSELTAGTMPYTWSSSILRSRTSSTSSLPSSRRYSRPTSFVTRAVIEMSKKAAARVRAGYNKLNLTPVGRRGMSATRLCDGRAGRPSSSRLVHSQNFRFSPA